ncbi:MULTISPECIES: non-ribosomal peptide synthetase [unclassified Sphingomonas]|jgi:amino acid adenylation domain-containing protein|uniref:non-ribosomal peptide synthetase n=1 Tax=unclassified Sphingomonas TaxID=196159 RepID=UPI0009E988B9|nr:MULTISPECIES: non-ribosomal peptide synthetase [unclassified Sphingomonas]
MNIAEDIAAYQQGRLSAAGILRNIRLSKLLDDKAFALSEGQRGLLAQARISPNSSVYNVPWCFRIGEQLDIDAFERSCGRVFEQYPVLRSRCVDENGDTHLRIGARPAKPLERHDVSGLGRNGIAAELEALTRRPFALDREAPLRIHLLTAGEADHYLLFVAHHIVVDGHSLPLIMAALWGSYDLLVGGGSLPPLVPDTGFSDFVDWQREWLTSASADRDLRHWESVLAQPWPRLDFPGARAPALSPRPRAEARLRTMDARLSSAVRALVRTERITPSVVFLAAYRVLLSGMSGETDIVIGTATSTRPISQVSASVGYFVNMLLLRATPSSAHTASELLQAEQHVLATAVDHGLYPFSKLLREIGRGGGRAATHGCQVAFSYVGHALMDWNAASFAGVSRRNISVVPNLFQQADCDLLLELREDGSTFDVVVKYDGATFADAAIDRMIDAYVRILQKMVDDPQVLTADLLPIAAESADVPDVAGSKSAVPAEPRWAHRLFEARASADPAAVAVRWAGQSLTYHELNARANQLARHLRACGVMAGSRVALCSRPSFAFIAGVLGILKAGATYVPLDPCHPRQRLAELMADSDPAAVLVSREGRDALAGAITAARLIDLEEADADWAEQSADNLTGELPADLLAYIIYTSGSTGQPKGAMIEHRSLARLLAAVRAAYGITEADRVLQFTSVSFDVSVLEIFLALTSGASLVIRDDRWIESPESLRQLCTEHGVTIVHIPTSLWHHFFVADGAPAPEGLRLLVVGGEAMLGDWLQAWHAQNTGGPRLLNQYGPTEATIVATLADLTASGSAPVIGRPLEHVATYVVRDDGELAIDGEAGELLIGGGGVGCGYLNRPDLTEQRFIPDRFSGRPGAMLYRTGDIVLRTAAGDLDYRGRIDRQIKLRGFRIELEEIEAQLARHPAVASVAVIASDAPRDADRQLIAYLVLADTDVPSAGELREFARSVLPDYMVPSAYVTLDALPLGPTGKRDLGALPLAADPSAAPYVDPRTPLEEALVAIYAELLKVDRIGIHDSFFELGGDSLKAVQVIARIRQLLDLEVPLPLLFEVQSVAELAEEIVAMLDESSSDLQPAS